MLPRATIFSILGLDLSWLLSLGLFLLDPFSMLGLDPLDLGESSLVFSSSGAGKVRLFSAVTTMTFAAALPGGTDKDRVSLVSGPFPLSCSRVSFISKRPFRDSGVSVQV